MLNEENSANYQAEEQRPISVQEFSKKIKEKYPSYKDVDDLTLATKIVDKYPEYKNKVTLPESSIVSEVTIPQQSSPVKPGTYNDWQVEYDEANQKKATPLKIPNNQDKWQGTGKESILQLAAGAHDFTAAIYGAPGFIYDLASAAHRKIGLNAAKYSETPISKPVIIAGYDVNPLSILERQKKILLDESRKITEKVIELNPNAANDAISLMSEGDVIGGLRNTFSNIARSTVPSVAMMLGGGYLSIPKYMGASTAVFGSMNLNEADQTGDYGKIGRDGVLAVSALNGSLEGFFERIMGSGAVGKSISNAIKKEGADQVKSAIQKSWSDQVSNLLTKTPWLAPFGEAYEEMGTQLSQNIVNKYSGYKPDTDIMDGVYSSGLTGAMSGAGHGLLIKSVQTGVNAANNVPQRAAVKKEFEQASASFNDIPNANYTEAVTNLLATYNDPKEIITNFNKISSEIGVEGKEYETALNFLSSSVKVNSLNKAKQAEIEKGINDFKDDNGNITSAEIEGEKYYIKNSADLGQSGRIIFAKNQKGEVKPFNASLVKSWETLTPDQITQTAQQKEAEEDNQFNISQEVSTAASQIGIEPNKSVKTPNGIAKIVSVNNDGTVTVVNQKGLQDEFSIDEVEAYKTEEQKQAEKEALAQQQQNEKIQSQQQEDTAKQEAETQQQAIEQQSTETTLEQPSIPKDKDGNPDYDAMDPEVFFNEYAKEFSEEEAKTEIQDMQRAIIEDIKKKTAKKSKATSANERAAIAREIKSLNTRLDNINGVLQKDRSKTDLGSDTKWVAKNSSNPDEIVSAYEQEKSNAPVNNLKEWQKFIIGVKFNPDSFSRFGDKNNVTSTLAKTWLNSDGHDIDQFIRDNFEDVPGFENVTEQDVIDFITENPTGQLRKTTDTQNELRKRYREITGVSIDNHKFDNETLPTQAKLESFLIENKLNDNWFTTEDLQSLVTENKDKLNENDYNEFTDYLSRELTTKQSELDEWDFDNAESSIQTETSASEDSDSKELSSTKESEPIEFSQSSLLNEATPEVKSTEGDASIKPIKQLGTGADVYFETDKYRVNENPTKGNIILNIGGVDELVPIANIPFDNTEEAVFIANKLNELAPEGLVSNYHNIPKIIENLKQEYKDSKSNVPKNNNLNQPNYGNVSQRLSEIPTNTGDAIQANENLLQKNETLGKESTKKSTKTAFLNITEKATLDLKEKRNAFNALNQISKEHNQSVEVINSTEIPEWIQSEERSRIAKGKQAVGFYNPRDGKVYIISDRIRSVSEVKKTYLHEIVAHKGLRGLFQDGKATVLGRQYEKFNDLMDEIFNSMSKRDIDKIAKSYIREYKGKEYLSTSEQRLVADEFLAHIAETEVVPTKFQNIIDRLVHLVRKTFGFTSGQFTQSDLLNIIKEQRSRMADEQKTEEKIDGDVRFKLLGNPRKDFPKVRGGWTKPKIIKELKEIKKAGLNYGKYSLLKGIASYENANSLRNHLFYHGTGSGIFGGLYPSITMSEKEAEQRGGGGYGQRYFAISVSKSKAKASMFSGMSRSVSVYPVLLNKEAKVINRPDIQDSAELEDEIEELWNNGVDAVRLGDWNDPSSEQELAVLNPNAISTWSESDSRMVYGSKMSDFKERTDKELEQIIDQSKEAVIKMAQWSEKNKLNLGEFPEWVDGMTPEQLSERKIQLAERKKIREEYQQLKRQQEREVSKDIRFRTQEQSEIIQNAKKYTDVEDFISAYKDADFRDAHSAPSFDDSPVEQRVEDGGDFNLIEVSKGFHTQPNDYFTPRIGARYYGYGDLEGMQSYAAISNIIRAVKSGNENQKITAYRSVPKNVDNKKLSDGDWITFSRQYAVNHGEHRFGEKEYRIIKQDVLPKDVWWDGNDINEWGYDTNKTEKLYRADLKRIWEEANTRFRLSDKLPETISIDGVNKYYVDKNYEPTKGGFYLRFTEDPFIDLEHKKSRWYMDDGELEIAKENGLKEGKDYFKDNNSGEYYKLHTGLSGHSLEAENLQDAIKEVESRNRWFKNAKEDNWSIYEGDDSDFSVKQDTPEGSTFAPYKVLYEREPKNNKLSNTILIDGVERPTTNSKGQPIADTEEKISNFYKWFGNSKVVDGEGRPLVVYHGGAIFNTFKKPETGDYGLYFTNNKDFAQDVFAMQQELYRRDGNNYEYDGIPEEMLESGEWDEKYLKYSEVKRVYLKIENPKHYESLDAKAIPKTYDSKHDGIIVDATGDFGYKGGQYVVFEPTQIKSATGNLGTFDESNPDIRFRVATSQQELDDFVKDSKIKETVYHGTPNATYDQFREGTIFTKNKEYAKRYVNQGASSISYKKTQEKPAVYSAKINLKKPFDTRQNLDRNIFNSEYQAMYSPQLSERGLVDWMEANDLAEWPQENYPKYDGIILDEGGEPVGDYVTGYENQYEKISDGFGWSGESYYIFSPKQALIEKIEDIDPIRFRIDKASEEVNTNPTDAQKEAGNYKKGHIKFDGFDISIENPKGSTRSGVDQDGESWKTVLPVDYGYFRGTVGKDKDHIDVFIGSKPEIDKVYVVDQINPKTGNFDEHKVMLGFNGVTEARKAYQSSYPKGWEGLKNITRTTKEGLKDWFENGNTKKPFADSDIRFRLAYHGSPHQFDKFTTEKIGTGEGNQAFGWGLYFTDKKSIAEDYANKLQPNRMLIDGKTFDQIQKEIGNTPAMSWVEIWHNDGMTKSQIINKLNEELKDKERLASFPWIEPSVKKTLDYLKNKEITKDANNRSVYAVELHGGKEPGEYDYLRWDKNIPKEQVDKINTQAEKEGINVSGVANTNYTGEWAYKELQKQFRGLDGTQEAASKFLLRAGIDGIQYPTEVTSKGSHEESFNYVIFDENAVEVKEHVRFRQADKPIQSEIGFYSPTEKALNAIEQEKGTAGQFEAMLIKNGAKQAELDWMGWKQQFPSVNQKVTKEDVQNWIDQNKIEVKEVVKGSDFTGFTPDEQKRFNYYSDEYISGHTLTDEEDADYTELSERLDNSTDDTKFSQYVEPGGSNYKEFVLTMPDQIEPYKPDNIHFTEEGGGTAVVWVRANEREVNGERVLFLEEIQSKRGQDGREKGFKGDYKNKSLVEPRFDGKYWYLYEKETSEQTSSQSFSSEAEAWKTVESTMRLMDNGVPNMPFRKTDQWVNLAFRRMMKYATENGFDRIAWTNGEQQAARYDLSKQISRITYTHPMVLRAYDKDGKKVISKKLNSDSELEDIIGKETARKLLEVPETKIEKTASDPYGFLGRELQGEDLHVGGEGMKAFYDAIVPSAANKLGKPFGAKVENIQIDVKPDITDEGIDLESGEVGTAPEGKYATVQSLPVTDKMIESVSQGVPLFRQSDITKDLSSIEQLSDIAFKVSQKSANTVPKNQNDDTEKAMNKAHGLKGETILSKIDRWKQEIKETTQHFKYVTEKEFPQIYNDLRLFESIPEVVKKDAYDKIANIVRPIANDKNLYKAFERYVVISDLMHDIKSGIYTNTVGIKEAAELKGVSEKEIKDLIESGEIKTMPHEKGQRYQLYYDSVLPGAPKSDTYKQLPFSMKSVDEVETYYNELREYINNNPSLRKVIANRNSIIYKVRDQLIENGLMSEKARDNTSYFHHMVMKYRENPEKSTAINQNYDVRVHPRGWQKSRTGSMEDYNTDYLQSEFEVIAQSLEQLAVKKSLQKIGQEVDIMPSLVAQANNEGGSWRDFIPEGYTTWHPKPMTNAWAAASMAEKAIQSVIEGNPLTESLNEQLAEADQTLWVIPTAIANQLDEMKTPTKEMLPIRGMRFFNSTWKQWVLLNPARLSKYMINNFSGDLDIVFAYNPKILQPKYAWTAAKELYNEATGEGMSKDMREAIENAVISSGLSIQEIPDVNKEGVFKTLTGDNNLFKKYWNTATSLNDFREGMLRLAAYKFFKEELNAGKTHHGVSNPKAVDSLRSNEEKAGKMARELLGDYGNLSQGGVWLRSHAYPFWSWMEINAPRYYKLLRNTYQDTNSVSKTTGAAIRKTAISSTALAARIMLLSALVTAWNRLFFPDEDDELTKTGNRQLRLITGRRDDGSIVTLRIQGAFSDVLSFVGLEDAYQDVRDIKTGKTTVEKKAKEAGSAFINRVGQGAMPFERLTGELITGKSVYPDILHPRPIIDRAEHAFRMVSLDKVYRFMTKKPLKKGGKELIGLVLYETDPGEAAYYAMRQRIYDFLDEKEYERPSGDPTEKSIALRYYKQAKKFKDTKLENHWLAKYKALGGTTQGMKTSIKKGEVTNALPRKYKKEFLDKLDGEDREVLEMAERWYDETYKK